MVFDDNCLGKLIWLFWDDRKEKYLTDVPAYAKDENRAPAAYYGDVDVFGREEGHQVSGELCLVQLSCIRCYFYGRFWVASKLGDRG